MNETVRRYLIRKSKQSKTAGYSEINLECNLNLNFNTQNSRNEIGRILGEISSHEFDHNRPLLSSIVVYKSDKTSIGLGNGFYKLAEELGFGNINKLKSLDFAELEMKKSFDYWGKQTTHGIDFFTKKDLDNFQQIAKTEYRKDNDVSHELAEIIKPIYGKSNYWGEQLKIDGFSVEYDNRWQSSGYFKAYSWCRIYREQDKGKFIYFTIGVDKGELNEKARLVYKLDCQWANSKSNKRLSEEQVRTFKNYIKGSGANWCEVDYNLVEDSNWEELIGKTRAFILEYQDLYDELVELIWNKKEQTLDSTLVLAERPNGTYSEYPPKEYSFKGVDKDYVAEQQKNQYIGSKGEKLVIKREKQKLIACGRNDLAEEVIKVKDGKGYDVFSYDKKGNIVHIEVKTTKGNSSTPFYMTDNELEFMRQNNKSYKIYRLYNFKPTLNSGEFFILSNIEGKIIKKPLLFEVQIKKR